MDVSSGSKTLKKIRYALIFFSFASVIGCGRGDVVEIEQVDYEKGRAVGVTFSTAMDVEKLRVFVGEESQTSVIGVIVSDKNEHSFTPVIPFTQGQRYTLRRSDTIILASFVIPKRKRTEASALLAIHPQVDTVPENLLKMYFEFAQPMQEVGNALDFITVTNDTDGIETQPFLKLESELWNKEHTLLTLWLDPGRIKTDLIPNKEKGLPLNAGKEYTLNIDPKWKSVEGSPLKERYSKKFYVGPRDNKMPNSKEWKLRIEGEDSVKSLYLDFKEPMDAFLAKETIRIYNVNGDRITGKFNLSDTGDELRFVPNNKWLSPEIEIKIESRLEDLAGNNLNHLFDMRLGDNDQQSDTTKVKSLRIRVE